MTIRHKAQKLMRTSCAALIVGGIAASVAPQSAEANQFKRIRDVNVACNNALRCDIYIANRSVTLNSFGFRRSAAPGAELQIVLGSRQPLRVNTDVTFSVDGVAVLTLDVSALNYRAATYEYFYRDPEQLSTLLKAGRAGSVLEISYTTRSGRSTVPFSLSGFTAGLIFADEVQGRIGDDDALMALSLATPDAQQPASDQTVREFKSWSDIPETLTAYFGSDNLRCSNEADDAVRPPLGGFETSLDETTSLISLPCGDSGAYNFPSAFWLKRGEQIAPLALPDMSDEGPVITDILWNGNWTPEAREISAFFKGRGIGDCGLYNRWKLSGSDGDYRFVLLEAKNKDNCDGIYKQDFSDYAQLWPLR